MTNAYESPLRVAPLEGEKIGKFTVVSVLGEGTFGTVYKVKDPAQAVYALKILRLYDLYPVQERPNVANRFALEFDTAQITSPHLVTSYEKGVEKGNPYFTMHFCSRGSLRHKVGSLADPAFIQKVAVDVLKGLKALHEHGKIHRDLKPDNILLDESGNARLTDFGIAGHLNLEKKEINQREVRLTTTDLFGRPKERFGSYPYMPPEQIKPPNRVVTKIPANDVFSFGATFFELITGQLPYGAITNEAELADYISRVNKGQWKQISLFRQDMPPVWQKIIDGCLQPDYKKRVQSVDDILKLLGQQAAPAHQAPISDGLVLKVMQGEEYGRTYPVGQMLHSRMAGLLTIGRMDLGIKNSVEIKDELLCYISRHHATLEKQGANSWFLRDGQWLNTTGASSWRRSTNGTFVNGVEIDHQGIELKINDIITIGDTTLKVLAS